MPRNSSGTHTLPAGNPVTTGTTISTTWANSTLGDLSTELSDSLSRSGKGPMTAGLKVVDGTAAVPGIAFNAEPGTGIYRAAAGDVRLALGGTDAVKVTATTAQVPGALGIGAPPNTAATALTLSAGFQPAVDFISTGGAAGNKESRLVYDSGVSLPAPGWVFQNISDTGAFVSNSLVVQRDGLVRLGTATTQVQPTSMVAPIGPNAGWTAGNGLAYWKDANGMVHVKGTATAGAGAGSVFTFPAGFRPAATRSFLVADTGSTTPALTGVDSAGNVNLSAPINLHTYALDVITFLAEQ